MTRPLVFNSCFLFAPAELAAPRHVANTVTLDSERCRSRTRDESHPAKFYFPSNQSNRLPGPLRIEVFLPHIKGTRGDGKRSLHREPPPGNTPAPRTGRA